MTTGLIGDFQKLKEEVNLLKEEVTELRIKVSDRSDFVRLQDQITKNRKRIDQVSEIPEDYPSHWPTKNGKVVEVGDIVVFNNGGATRTSEVESVNFKNETMTFKGRHGFYAFPRETWDRRCFRILDKKKNIDDLIVGVGGEEENLKEAILKALKVHYMNGYEDSTESAERVFSVFIEPALEKHNIALRRIGKIEKNYKNEDYPVMLGYLKEIRKLLGGEDV